MTHTLTPKPEMRQKWGVGVGGRQRVQPHSNVKGEQINDAGPGARFSSPPSTPRVSAPPSGLASNHPHQLKTQLCPLSYADGRQVPTWPPGLIPLPGPRPATHSFLSPSPEPRRPVHLQAAAQQPGARPRPASDQAGPPWHRAPGGAGGAEGRRVRVWHSGRCAPDSASSPRGPPCAPRGVRRPPAPTLQDARQLLASPGSPRSARQPRLGPGSPHSPGPAAAAAPDAEPEARDAAGPYHPPSPRRGRTDRPSAPRRREASESSPGPAHPRRPRGPGSLKQLPAAPSASGPIPHPPPRTEWFNPHPLGLLEGTILRGGDAYIKNLRKKYRHPRTLGPHRRQKERERLNIIKRSVFSF